VQVGDLVQVSADQVHVVLTTLLKHLPLTSSGTPEAKFSLAARTNKLAPKITRIQQDLIYYRIFMIYS
jgi:hypothetical protein